MDLREIDVVGTDAGALVSVLSRGLRERLERHGCRHDIDGPRAQRRGREVHGSPVAVPLGRPIAHHDDGCCPIGDRGTVVQVQRVGDRARLQHVCNGDLLAEVGEGVAGGIPLVLDGDERQLLARHAELFHVAASAHRIHRGHRCAHRSFRITGIGRQRAAEFGGEVLGSYGRHDIVFPGPNRQRSLSNRRCSAATCVFDVGERQPGETHLRQDPLAGDHALEDVAAIGGFDGTGIDPGVGDGAPQGFRAQVGGVPVRVFPELGHARAENVNGGHCSPPAGGRNRKPVRGSPSSSSPKGSSVRTSVIPILKSSASTPPIWPMTRTPSGRST